MEIAEILDQKLEDISSILDLPFPEFTEIETASSGDLYKVLEKFLVYWKELLIGKTQFEIETYEVKDPHQEDPETLTGDEVWHYLFMKIAAYYDYSLQKYLEKEEEKSELPPGLNFGNLTEFIPSDEIRRDPDKVQLKYVVLRILSHHYFSLYFTLYFLNIFNPLSPPPFMTAEFERQFINHLEGMFDIVSKIDSKYLKIITSYLYASVLEYASSVYDKRGGQNLKHMPGPFSAINLPDLSLLAERAESVCARYGNSNVARVFENQLALIAQSFGLFVVSTRVGLNTVDLVCISSQPDEKITFVIEAKTSKRAYYLPKDDARALKDYVTDLRSSLSSLPPLSFVLILGPGPSSTLQSKLNDLQASIGLPIRFMTAQQFANLREFIPGPLPLRIFKKMILAGESVIADQTLESVVDAYKLEQDAHSAFLESMISAKGISDRLPSSVI